MCLVEKEKKVVVLTGAYRNIGAMLIKELVNDYVVWPVCRTIKQAGEINDLYCKSDQSCFHGDLRDMNTIDKLAGALQSVPLHGLIHCVGPIEYSDEGVPDWDSWTDMYEANMKSAVNLVRLVGPGMKSGRIILFGFSGNDTASGFKQIAAYAAAKESIAVLARSAALEYALSGTTVNVIAPGVFKTDIGKIPQKGAELMQKIPLRRFGESDDISGVVKWILGPGSAYVTGQIIKVSGGLHI